MMFFRQVGIIGTRITIVARCSLEGFGTPDARVTSHARSPVDGDRTINCHTSKSIFSVPFQKQNEHLRVQWALKFNYTLYEALGKKKKIFNTS